jgi:hypothetical protein
MPDLRRELLHPAQPLRLDLAYRHVGVRRGLERDQPLVAVHVRVGELLRVEGHAIVHVLLAGARAVGAVVVHRHRGVVHFIKHGQAGIGPRFQFAARAVGLQVR